MLNHWRFKPAGRRKRSSKDKKNTRNISSHSQQPNLANGQSDTNNRKCYSTPTTMEDFMINWRFHPKSCTFTEERVFPRSSNKRRSSTTASSSSSSASSSGSKHPKQSKPTKKQKSLVSLSVDKGVAQTPSSSQSSKKGDLKRTAKNALPAPIHRRANGKRQKSSTTTQRDYLSSDHCLSALTTAAQEARNLRPLLSCPPLSLPPPPTINNPTKFPSPRTVTTNLQRTTPRRSSNDDHPNRDHRSAYWPREREKNALSYDEKTHDLPMRIGKDDSVSSAQEDTPRPTKRVPLPPLDPAKDMTFRQRAVVQQRKQNLKRKRRSSLPDVFSPDKPFQLPKLSKRAKPTLNKATSPNSDESSSSNSNQDASSSSSNQSSSSNGSHPSSEGTKTGKGPVQHSKQSSPNQEQQEQEQQEDIALLASDRAQRSMFSSPPIFSNQQNDKKFKQPKRCFQSAKVNRNTAASAMLMMGHKNSNSLKRRNMKSRKQQNRKNIR